MVSKTNRKAFHHSSFFLLEKKRYGEIHAISSQPHSLFLYINLKLVPFVSNLSVHSL